jgi:oligopeptide/dipeptide ABC transporter ATP-binding protein
VVAEVANTVAVMYCGRIVEQAPVAELFAEPQHPYTVGLLGSMPRLHGQATRLAAIAGQVPGPLDRPAGCRFADRCPFVMPRCREAQPELQDLGNGHLAACWRAPLDADTLLAQPVQAFAG